MDVERVDITLDILRNTVNAERISFLFVNFLSYKIYCNLSSKGSIFIKNKLSRKLRRILSI